MYKSNIQFTVALLACLISQVSSTGIFKLELFQFSNDKGLLNDNTCCSGPQTNNVCIDKCSTSFEICIKHYERSITPGECSFGEFSTEVMGNNTFNFPREQRVFTNPLEFFIGFAWPGDFSLIIDAYHQVSSTPKSRALIATFQGSSRKLPADGWKMEQWNSTSPQSIKFRHKIECEDSFFGDGCTKICTERDDELGHYECDAQGERVCRQGWKGEYCDTAICLEGCNEAHGSCSRPNECSCKTGWQGKLCDKCLAYPGCQNGYCEDLFECVCFEGWGGLFCNQDLNYCTHNKPCKNGGTCTNTGEGSYTCTCPIGFSGTNCEIEADNCRLQPCENGGVCKDVGNDFECECPAGYSGSHCEISAARCNENPCANGGICEQVGDSYRCKCSAGWVGVNCQSEVDECMQRAEGQPEPCLNGGRCIDGSNSYSCVCPNGFSGEHCEIDEDECAGQNPCLNGGQCEDGNNGYQCRCRPGFIGELCEIDFDDCVTRPCANGGRCTDKENDFQCFCAPGFTGRFCTEQINECASSPCVAGRGTCEDRINGFVCHCTPQYEGNNCQYRLGKSPSSTERVTRPPTTSLSTTLFSMIGTPKAGAVKTDDSATGGDVELTQSQLILIVSLGSGIPMVLLFLLVTLLLCRRCRRKVDNDKGLEARQNEINGMNNRIHNPVSKNGGGKLAEYEYPTTEKVVNDVEVVTSGAPMSLDYKNSAAALSATKVLHKDLIKDINRGNERELLNKANAANRQQQLSSVEHQYRQYCHQERLGAIVSLSEGITPDDKGLARNVTLASDSLDHSIPTVCGVVTAQSTQHPLDSPIAGSSDVPSDYISRQQHPFRHSNVHSIHPQQNSGVSVLPQSAAQHQVTYLAPNTCNNSSQCNATTV